MIKPLTWVEIDKEALIHNIKSYKQIGEQAALAIVVKGNAYGHGMELIARIGEESPQVDWLCTVNLTEAVQLRACGITKPILVLSIIDQPLEESITHNIDVPLYSIEAAMNLNTIASTLNKKARVHVKIDTGLSRVGIHTHQALAFIQEINKLPHIEIRGIFTHFAESESADQSFTTIQITLFEQLLVHLKAVSIHIPYKHTSCSAAITANKACHYTLKRAGIGIYGLWPSEENKIVTQHYYPDFTLKPVLSWKTTIIQIKEVPASSYVGYDRTYQTIKPAKIALLPIGYWDGYDRELSNKGFVMIHGQLVPIIGRIAMNLTMVDVTSVPHVAVGDMVCLLGNHAGITADDLARHCATINYEMVTRINPLLPRLLK